MPKPPSQTVSAKPKPMPSLAQGQFFGEADEAVDLGVQRGDTRQQGLGQLFGGKLFIGETAGDLGQSHVMHERLFPFSR